jgi:SlyX protein
MSDAEALAARIDTLEVRIAHQDRIIDDLNEAVTSQWKKIDVLTRQIVSLLDRVQEAEGRSGAPNAPEPPPPHY